MGSVATTAATATTTAIVITVIIVDQQENDDDEQDPSAIVAAEQVTQTHSFHPLTTPYYDGTNGVVKKNCRCCHRRQYFRAGDRQDAVGDGK